MSIEYAIDVKELSKRYRRGVLANDAISLGVPAGSIFGLIGPNGAGKTTLVRQIAGQLAPTSGSVLIHGIDVLREPLRAKRLLGVVPQEVAPLDYLTPRQHLLTFGRLHGRSGRDVRRRTDEILADLDLLGHADKASVHLSGGLKHKVLVGIALIAEPSVLLLDEPTTGLDPRSRREVWTLVRSLQSQGATTLITTHYMDEAELLCDRIAIVGRGRILAEGSVDDLRSRRRTNFKATFVDHIGHQRTAFGETQQDVLAAVEEMGIAEFSVSRTTLEDVFLELTNEGVEKGHA